jgi:hypothetical protein
MASSSALTVVPAVSALVCHFQVVEVAASVCFPAQGAKCRRGADAAHSPKRSHVFA